MASKDPALIFAGDLDAPGTHVLLIGIGAYPYLEDGESYDPEEHEENAMGMAQLNAPPVSMRRLADWFLDHFNNADRPLASVALILSEAEPATYSHPRAGEDIAVPSGTIIEVQKAVAAWTKRASVHRDNATIFAFCGHGVQSGDAVLLCRDYGEIPQSRFQGAIDFEQFRIALSTNQPDTQLFLIDACRTPDTENALLGQVTPGNPLLDMQSLQKRDGAPAAQCVQFATSLYTEAWGRTDGPSLFTEVLIKALAGGAADHTQDWWVTTGRLHTTLSTYLQRVSAEEGVIQKPAAQSQDFRITKPGPIAVDLYVRSQTPEVWDEAVSIKAKRGNFEETVEHRPANVRPDHCYMQLVNPTQRPVDVTYNVAALFEQESEFADYDEDIIAYPPEVVCNFSVSKRP